MARIRSKNTSPEIVVRKILTGLGVRYRLHVKTLPGKPDIVIRKRKMAFFVNGCFWHQHKDCKRSNTPKSNKTYWAPKLKRNVVRQKDIIAQLEKEGWRVSVIWECQTKDAVSLKNRVHKLLLV